MLVALDSGWKKQIRSNDAHIIQLRNRILYHDKKAENIRRPAYVKHDDNL